MKHHPEIVLAFWTLASNSVQRDTIFENIICNEPNNEVKCHGATSVLFQSNEVHHIGVREKRLSVKSPTGFSVNCV